MSRVCHVTSAHPERDIRIFRKECRSLARAGHEVWLVERGASGEEDGVHLYGVGALPKNRLLRMTVGAQRVYRAARALDAEIYHLHDPELLPYARKLKRAGKKVIFDSHEFYAEQIAGKTYLPRSLAALLSRIYARYESSVLRELDAVVYPCTIAGREPFSAYCRRAVIVSNAADLAEFAHREADAQREETLVCYVGSLTEARGITVDMLACAKAGATLALAGTFASAEYRARLAAMPEFSTVRECGQLDRAQVRSLLSRSAVGLCTLQDVGQYLKIDTFGIKVYEYMAMGLPVLLSRSAYNERMVRQYGFGLCVDAGDVDALAEAIRFLLDHPDEARQMGVNGRRAVETVFNWGVEEKKLLALYDEILRE